MPKFKRLPKKAKPFKFELEEAFTITPRFDREFWEGKEFDGNGICRREAIIYLSPCKNLLYFNDRGFIFFKEGGKNNGLTCHRDHSWAINSGAPHAHDLLLAEGYGGVYLTGRERAIVDRVFLSVLLDHVDTLTGFKKSLYKSFAYAMYWAVRANSIIKG